MSDQRRRNQKVRQTHEALFASMGLTIDAQATSTSGRWKMFLGAHQREGTPCFDVLAIRVDMKIECWHFWALASDQGAETYDQSRDRALAEARGFYEALVARMQEPAKEEESDEDKGLEVLNPDGTRQKYSIN